MKFSLTLMAALAMTMGVASAKAKADCVIILTPASPVLNQSYHVKVSGLRPGEGNLFVGNVGYNLIIEYATASSAGTLDADSYSEFPYSSGATGSETMKVFSEVNGGKPHMLCTLAYSVVAQ